MVPKLRFKEFKKPWVPSNLGAVSESLNYGLNVAAAEYDGANKYVRITDIDDESRQYLEDGKVSPAGSMTDDYLVKEGDILLARTGASTGKSYLYREEDGKMYFAGFLIRSRIKSTVDHRFVYFQTLSNNYDKWVKVMSMRSGQPGINATEYASFEFNLPEKGEQQKIANFLSLFDQKLKKQKEKIEQLELFKKGMMQKIFSQKFRFKDEKGQNFPTWKQKPLKDFVERITRKNKDLESNLPLTISAQHGLVDQVTFFNKTVASTNLESYYLLYKGEFAYNKSYSNGYPFGAIKRLEKYEKGVLSSLYICFKVLNSVSSDYLTHYFESTFWHKEVSMISVEGARNHGLLNISVSDFFETLHCIPSLKEQEKIASFLSDINLKLEKEKEKLISLTNLKKGLMQQMFI
jgi:type I restriction enzyme S subunit